MPLEFYISGFNRMLMHDYTHVISSRVHTVPSNFRFTACGWSSNATACSIYFSTLVLVLLRFICFTD